MCRDEVAPCGREVRAILRGPTHRSGMVVRCVSSIGTKPDIKLFSIRLCELKGGEVESWRRGGVGEAKYD